MIQFQWSLNTANKIFKEILNLHALSSQILKSNKYKQRFWVTFANESRIPYEESKAIFMMMKLDFLVAYFNME